MSSWKNRPLQELIAEYRDALKKDNPIPVGWTQIMILPDEMVEKIRVNDVFRYRRVKDKSPWR